MGKNKKIILAAVAFVAVVAVFLAVFLVKKKNDQEKIEDNAGDKTITVTVIREGYEDKVWNFSTDQTYLAGALDEQGIVKAENIQDGMFFTVDGYTTNSNDDEWWCVNVNGEMANYGIQDIILEDGDAYEIVLMVGYESF